MPITHQPRNLDGKNPESKVDTHCSKERRSPGSRRPQEREKITRKQNNANRGERERETVRPRETQKDG